jgi:hypothetical protein
VLSQVKGARIWRWVRLLARMAVAAVELVVVIVLIV